MEPCPFQGPGKQNPVNVGGYDLFRPTEDKQQDGYWIGSGQSILFDAGLNEGTGGTVVYEDLARISKGAALNSAEECDCHVTVTLDLEAKPATFQYFPPHSLDVVIVLDVTSSMMTSGSTKFVQAKRAMVDTINKFWASNRDTTVTIIPYARDAFVPNPAPATGFGYDYLGTLFSWKRSSAPGPASYYIGQILGYRNQSFVSATALNTFEAQSQPLAASVELSLYSFYNFYKIRYSDVYDASGNPLPDTVLSTYIANVFTPNPAAYVNNQLVKVAAGTPLTPQEATYSVNPDFENNTILQNAIWSIPYGEDTNTEAGLKAAYDLFKTPGFAQSDDIYRRVVLLITDGQANRSDNPQYPGVYAAPGDTDAQFFPDVGGDPWKYFLYLKQTMPTLVGEVSNRSATFEEIILASQRGQEISNKLKAPGDGNTLLFGLGIDINAQNPGPYTRQNVLDLMRSWVSAPSFFRESNTSDPDSQIAETLARLVQDIFQLSAGSRLVVHDRINTALFRYVPGSIRISGVRDGLLLKSPNQPDIIDPSDPNYTVYPKAPLLPDVDDNTFVDGGFVLDLGTMPLGLLTQDSRTSVTITYEIESNRLANGDHLHTNTDDQTYAAFTEPNHLEASTSAIDYSAPVRNLLFHTPIVACSCAPTPGLSVEKFVDRTSAAPGDRVNYTIIVHNTGTLRLVNVHVTDARLGLDFTIPAIEPLTSYTESVAYTIPPGTPPGALVNTVFASNELFPDPLNASAVVNVSESPSLVLTKSVDKRQARPGETVVFTITVTNNGNVPIENARFVDELLGISTTIESIAAGATLSADLPYVIPDDAAIGSTIVNVAVLTTAELPPLTAAVSVEVLAQPRLSLTKTVDRKQTAPGTTIQFTLTVTNTGSMPLTNVRVSDPTLALDTTIPSLLPGESVVIPQPFNVPLETPPTVYTNTVTATSDQTTPVTATEQVEVLAQPALGIRKVVDRPTASHGEAVQYTIQVANFGNVPLVGIRLTDEVLGVDLQIEGLEIGEIWTREFSYTVPSTAVIGSRIVNRATASNSATGTVEATATITVVGTGLSIAKTVSPAFGAPGEIVTYTLTVTNLLNVAQTNVVLTDTLLGLNETVPVLGPGQSIVRNGPFVLPDVPEGTVLPNVFSSASDQSGVQSTEAKVLVQRELTDAALRVTKSASANLAPLGSLIEYTVTVTNVGAGAATNIDVRDSLTGTAAFIPFLAPGASETVVFFYAIPDSLPGSPIVTNRVVATSPQTNPASAEASVRVGVPHHLLHLTNVVDKPVVPPGTTVHFTFTVTNQSPFILHDVRVFGEITGFETIIPVLLPGESRAFVVPFVVPTDAISGMVFVETASAFSLETPFQQAPASVIPVVNADFTLSETVDKPVVPPQTRVHFTIQTTNVGNADLINFRVFASLLSLRVRVVRFPIGATLRGRFPFDTPDTDEEIVIPSPVTAEADNAGPKRVEVSVRVIPEDEE